MAVSRLSAWHQGDDEWTFPNGMPLILQQKARRMRRNMLIHGYLSYGMKEPVLRQDLLVKWASELTALQAAWGWEWNFYDSAFSIWDGIESMSILYTNEGHDNGVLNAALNVQFMHKTEQQRKAAAEEQRARLLPHIH